MSEEKNAILKFIEKTRQEIEGDQLAYDDLKTVALKVLSLYEGEVGTGSSGIATEEAAYKDDSFEFEDDFNEQY